MIRVFIDGAEGTTGLRIRNRLENRSEFKIISLSDELRKDKAARSDAINLSDVTILCLPDNAAVEAVSMVKNENVKIIDASTAHRTSDGWAYGFPQLDKAFYNKIASGKRIAVPGCHASGILALVYPLVKNGYLNTNSYISATSLTGYSGGGKSMIKDYENPDNYESLLAPRMYALSQTHKHINEIMKVSALTHIPVFNPIVCNFYSGMLVSIPLNINKLSGLNNINQVKDFYFEYYKNLPLMNVENDIITEGTISANSLKDRDNMKIFLSGTTERFTLNAIYDNLGKGASGAAIECLNITCGLPQDCGLCI